LNFRISNGIRADKSNKKLGSGALSTLEWLLLSHACKVIASMSFSIKLVMRKRINFAENAPHNLQITAITISGAVVCRSNLGMPEGE
jgi:hypothetical protein